NEQIKAHMYRIQMKYRKIGLCIIDHLNLVDTGSYGERHGMAAGTSSVADATQRLAKTFECHVLGLVQFNLKAMSERRDHRPTMADFRLSGNFAQNTDNAVLLHREIQWVSDKPPEMERNEFPNDYVQRKSKWEFDREDLKIRAEAIIGK